MSELNRLARLAIEKTLPSCWVSGEISNFTRASSGHWYFTLKDAQAGVRCALFRNRSQFIDWIPTEGDKVEVRAQATLYEARGEYQLIVDAMRRAGQGALFEEFLRLKSKLEAEGLFRTEKKLELPRLPKRLGIVTSLQAAALQDVLRTLELRWPNCPIVIYPTAVQGSDAAEMIVQSLQTAIKRNECDVVLLVRGGGSLEDLHPFNNEQLARAIFASPVPIITGIGHETDFSIADFVADVRAATPTAAAQIAVPDRMDAVAKLSNVVFRLSQAGTRSLSNKNQNLDELTRRLVHPGTSLGQNQKLIMQFVRRLALSCRYTFSNSNQELGNRLKRLEMLRPDLLDRRTGLARHIAALSRRMETALNAWRMQQEKLANSLQQLNPENVLSRGYCIATDERGEVIKNTNSLRIGGRVDIKAYRGRFVATVNQVDSDSS